MAALDFPNAPSIGNTYTGPNGAVYTWDGAAWTVSGVLSTGSAAGGDLSGTYPNPTVAKSSANPFTVPGSAICNTTNAATGGRGNLAAFGPDGLSLGANDMWGPPAPSLASWNLTMKTSGDIGFYHRLAGAGTGTTDHSLALNNTGSLTITGTVAVKASGTTWANPSDPRLKQDVAPYPRGLAEVVQLDPIAYRLIAEPDGPLCYGFDAAAVKPVFPECVSETTMKLAPDDAEPTAGVLSFDMHPILVALVTAVKELAAEVAALKAAAVAPTHA